MGDLRADVGGMEFAETNMTLDSLNLGRRIGRVEDQPAGCREVGGDLIAGPLVARVAVEINLQRGELAQEPPGAEKEATDLENAAFRRGVRTQYIEVLHEFRCPLILTKEKLVEWVLFAEKLVVPTLQVGEFLEIGVLAFGVPQGFAQLVVGLRTGEQRVFLL